MTFPTDGIEHDTPPARPVTVAAIQFACSSSLEDNCARAEAHVRDAAARGANIILLPELFTSRYFPIDQTDHSHLAVAQNDANSFVSRFQLLAGALRVVLPISFYERVVNTYFNSVCVFDADGTNLGTYRKSHIPDGPGYQEKFYFTPGQTGFRSFKTAFGRIGVAICWDQWFPEAARCMVLDGAEMLLYPTAIGSEPQDPAYDSLNHWQRCMQGHAAANMVPVIAANRIGTERAMTWSATQTFYGASFITDHTGGLLSVASKNKEQVVVQTFDLERIRKDRLNWGLFRDRRPELYSSLVTFGERDIRGQPVMR